MLDIGGRQKYSFNDVLNRTLSNHMYQMRGDDGSEHKRTVSASGGSKYTNNVYYKSLDKMMIKKRLDSLKEQTHYQNIYKQWMYCDNVTAMTTFAGFAIVVFYHVWAIRRLKDYCDMQGIQSIDCKKELLLHRFADIGA